MTIADCNFSENWKVYPKREFERVLQSQLRVQGGLPPQRARSLKRIASPLDVKK